MEILIVGALLLASFSSPRAGQADPITFAQFKQQDSAAKPFVFTNSGAASTFSVAPTLVDFSFSIPNGTGLPPGTNILADLSISSIVNGTAASFGGLSEQEIQQVDIKFVANDPAHPSLNGDTLLAVIAAGSPPQSTGDLYGASTGHTGVQFADTSVGYSFQYSSDFLVLPTNPGALNYSITMSSVIPNFSVAGNGYLNSFTASGAGTFAIPEPSSVVLAGLGAVGFFLAAIRRSRVRIAAL